MAKNKVIIDDGCNPELVETAFFDGILEMPRLLHLEKFVIPKGIVPFSKRNRSKACQDFIGFYEPDVSFGDFLRRRRRSSIHIETEHAVTTARRMVYTLFPIFAGAMNVAIQRNSCQRSSRSSVCQSTAW